MLDTLKQEKKYRLESCFRYELRYACLSAEINVWQWLVFPELASPFNTAATTGFGFSRTQRNYWKLRCTFAYKGERAQQKGASSQLVAEKLNWYLRLVGATICPRHYRRSETITWITCSVQYSEFGKTTPWADCTNREVKYLQWILR